MSEVPLYLYGWFPGHGDDRGTSRTWRLEMQSFRFFELPIEPGKCLTMVQTKRDRANRNEAGVCIACKHPLLSGQAIEVPRS